MADSDPPGRYTLAYQGYHLLSVCLVITISQDRDKRC